MNAKRNANMTQYQEATFTVRLDGEGAKPLSITDINNLNEDLASKGLDKLVKIKRSSGETEYVTKGVLKQLEQDRMRRKNQRVLADMRNNPTKPKKENRFKRALKELLS